jgi:outer membrane protein assembly factor BamA
MVRDPRSQRRKPIGTHYLCSLIILLAIASPATIYAQQLSSAKLAKLEFEGIKSLSKDQLAKTSGLELGQAIDVEALDAAAQRLMASGLLKKLSYRFRTNANQATVIFEIEEATTIRHPVIFDNFIWFTRDELMNAVRREIPAFDGMVLDNGNMTETITHALQLMLTEHKIGGKVEYTPSGDLSGRISGHLFAVRGLRIPICTLHFPGARNVDEARLIKSSKDLIGTDYSNSYASSFASSNLLPIYRELGQLKAAFAPPEGKPQSSANCDQGVEVTIPVAEGLVYKWDKTEWSGNQVLAGQQLDLALGMKPGEIANGLKFDKGIVAVHKAYGRKGYIAASLRPHATFDDANSRVAYLIEIKEGPQYHMGNLIVKGFSESLTNYLRGKFEMLRGDVYDQGYVEEFFKGPFREVMRKVAQERQAEGKPAPKNVTTDEKPNTLNLTVDVTIELRDERLEP